MTKTETAIVTAIQPGDTITVPGISTPVLVDRVGHFVSYGSVPRFAIHGRTMPGLVLVTVHADEDQRIERHR